MLYSPENLTQAESTENIPLESAPQAVAGYGWASQFVMILAKFVARLNPLLWMLLDASIAALALKLSYKFSPKTLGLEPTIAQLIAFPLLIVLSGHITGMYERMMIRRRTQFFVAVLSSSILAVLGMVMLLMLVYYEKTGRWIMLLSAGIFLPCALIPRILAFYLVQYYRIRILLVGGDSENNSALARRLKSEKYHFQFIGICSELNSDSPDNGDVIGSIEDIPRICLEQRIDELVIANEYLNHPKVLDQCFSAVQSGCILQDECTFYEDFFEQIPVGNIDESWFFRSRINLNYRFQILMKRWMDIALSICGLILFAPLFPLVWIAIRLSSTGPVFYSQTRIGQFGRNFQIYKFRTMTINAEEDGVKWAGADDSRVTSVGRLLRKSRLDEIPQFWNILRGDMSFVGPRPERPELVEMIEREVPFFSFRHWARPGLTGLAQIRYRYGASVKDARKKLQHDLFYIKNWSLTLDVRILLRTFAAFLKGAR